MAVLHLLWLLHQNEEKLSAFVYLLGRKCESNQQAKDLYAGKSFRG
uniref:Uncharacterized protein n=1 Tax=Anguilla anguilla TaxID=7936 RepID=A0A0E9VKS3_ANGAN